MSGTSRNEAQPVLEKGIKLKTEFPLITFEQWKEKVEQDLNGADFDKKLLTETYEGITLKPIYTSEDLKQLSNLNEMPGFGNFCRGTDISGFLENGWLISQSLNIPDATEFNCSLRNAINRGQNCVLIPLDSATQIGLDADYADLQIVGDTGLSLSAVPSMERVFNNIDLREYPLHVDTGFSALPFFILFKSYLDFKNIKLSDLNGAITSDVFGSLLKHGNLSIKVESALSETEMILQTLSVNSSNLRSIGISGYHFTDAGATAVQEIAFSLAAANEYINYFLDKGYEINEIAKRFQLNLGIGSFYFMEVAKFRAVRILWSNLLNAYGADEKSRKIFVHAQSSLYNNSKLDPNVNMLRATTEAFSAIIGGANSIETKPYDTLFGKADEFSSRLARNTQIVLKEESHLTNLIDPAGGSYYVEYLTEEIAASAWKLFQSIEEDGGFLKAIKAGTIQKQISDTSTQKNKDYSKRKAVMVGTNMYSNLKEYKINTKLFDQEDFKAKRAKYLQNYRVDGKADKHNSILDKLNTVANAKGSELVNLAASVIQEGATIGEVTKTIRAGKDESVSITKLNFTRASEPFERLKLIAESIKQIRGYDPKVFLATMGTVKEFKGRADFSRAFFETGGFEVEYPGGFESNDDAATEVQKSKADVVVICSTDEKYPEIVPSLVAELKDANKNIHIILAGYPKDQIEKHKESGIDEFIYLGCDARSILDLLLQNIKENNS